MTNFLRKHDVNGDTILFALYTVIGEITLSRSQEGA
jgi:hypothetical protein